METFTCELLETRELSFKVRHYGIVAFIPRSVAEKVHIIDNAQITLTIPYGIYKEKFES